MNKVLLNTLYVLSKGGGYLKLDHDTVRVERQGKEVGRVPLHHLGGMVLSEDTLVSPALLGACAQRGMAISWLNWQGQFSCAMRPPTQGNILLRLAQYQAYCDPPLKLNIAKELIIGKLANSRHTLTRRAREAKLPEHADLLRKLKARLDAVRQNLDRCSTEDELRGIEGSCAQLYFEGFDAMVDGSDFIFERRSRRPPQNPYNALLSFLYTLLVHDCTSACEGVGLDPQLGFLHEPRPGRPSCALDLAEELRSPLVDRLVFAMINRRQISAQDDFETRPGGAIYLNDTGRKKVLEAYQRRKQEEIPHPLFEEKVPFGLVPHIQARLLARRLRGDLEQFPSFELM